MKRKIGGRRKNKKDGNNKQSGMKGGAMETKEHRLMNSVREGHWCRKSETLLTLRTLARTIGLRNCRKIEHIERSTCKDSLSLLGGEEKTKAISLFNVSRLKRNDCLLKENGIQENRKLKDKQNNLEWILLRKKIIWRRHSASQEERWRENKIFVKNISFLLNKCPVGCGQFRMVKYKR